MTRLLNCLILFFFLSPVSLVTAETEFVEQRRLRLWSAQIQNRDLIYTTYSRIKTVDETGPSSWVYEWSQIGDYYFDLGKENADKGDTDAARDAYLKAAKLYGIARFPAKTLPGQKDAYARHLESYKLAGVFFTPALKVIKIPYDGKTIDAYLHLPEGIEKPPLILWNGGIDTWKGDVYNNFLAFVEAGFAVLSFDVLGTGENSDWPARPDANDLHSAVIDFMQDHEDIDGRYIAHVGYSFSGYYAARNALTEPRLFAVISACGPVHDGWSVIYRDGVWEIKEALSTAMHLDRDDEKKMQAMAESFSLVRQGLLNGEDSLLVPTLIVNGDQDNLAPVSDLRLLADSGQETDLWIMGGDQHCFGQYRPVVSPRMAIWLSNKLEAFKSRQ